jgi:hypothetical protein
VKGGGLRKGCWDAHTHLSAGAADLHDLDLREARSTEAIEAALRAAAQDRPAGRWIEGWGWDGRSSIHDVAPHRPVFVARRDGHAAWVNPAGRAILGLDPEDSVVEEAAFDAARARLPQRSADDRADALRVRLAELAALQVSAVDDIVESWGPDVYTRLRDRGELSVAIRMWLSEGLPDHECEALRREFPADDPRQRAAQLHLDVGGLEGQPGEPFTEPLQHGLDGGPTDLRGGVPRGRSR